MVVRSVVTLQTNSHNGGEEALKRKGILNEIHEMPAIWNEHPYQRDYSARSDAMSE